MDRYTTFWPKHGVVRADDTRLLSSRENTEMCLQAIEHQIVFCHELPARVILRLQTLTTEVITRYKAVNLTH